MFGYSISTSHYSPPYFVTRLSNKFVAVCDFKIVLAVLLFILLVPKLYSCGA